MNNKSNFIQSITHRKPIVFYPVVTILSIVLILFIFLAAQLNSSLNINYYIDARLYSGTIQSFENDDSLKMIKINNNTFVADAKSLPPHVEDNDVIKVVIDNEGHILNNERYRLDNVIYENGYPEDTTSNKVYKAVNYEDYVLLSSDSQNSHLEMLMTCYQLFAVIFAVLLLTVLISSWYVMKQENKKLIATNIENISKENTDI